MGEKVSAKTMAVDDKPGKKGFGNDDQPERIYAPLSRFEILTNISAFEH